MSEDHRIYFNRLDETKKVSKAGVEFWMARDLQILLGYDKWANFESAIKRAMESCASGDVRPENHLLTSARWSALEVGYA